VVIQIGKISSKNLHNFTFLATMLECVCFSTFLLTLSTKSIYEGSQKEIMHL
jgi:hypothetical protein